MIILEENSKWHLEAFASELFICNHVLIHWSTKMFNDSLSFIEWFYYTREYV